jgi:hypothetical protein
VSGTPGGLAGEDATVPQHEGRHGLAFATQILDRGVPRANQIPQRLMGLVRNPHLREFAGPQQPGERDRIPPIGLDPNPWLARDQRRSHHDAVVAESRELAIKPIAGRPGLVAEVKPLILRGKPRYDLAHALRRCLDLAQIADLPLSARLGDGDRVSGLGRVDSNKGLAILQHGSSSLR